MAIKALIQNAKGYTVLSQEGEFSIGNNYSKLATEIGDDIALVCYKKSFHNLPVHTMDILELFAFVHPATFCIPSIKGLCAYLKISEPVNSYEEAERLFIILEKLLEEASYDQNCYHIAKYMADAGWKFGPLILERFRAPPGNTHTVMLWNHLEDLKDEHEKVEMPAVNKAISDKEIDSAIKNLYLKEDRKAQHEYAKFTRLMFSPLQKEGEINLLLSEAGTGIGKTLGYLIPAHLWAKKNNAAVWISTYTKALQNQLFNELDKIFPNPQDKSANVVIRKGRENYLCLLNFEEALKKISLPHAIMAGIIARHVLKTNDGDLNGPMFAGWIEDVVGYELLASITDKRGECLYNACPFFRKCFVEKVIAKSKKASIVITNHALLMNLAQKQLEDGETRLPPYYIFDEGHHVFHAADDAFSASFSVLECYDLRKWVLGLEEQRKSSSRMKGLRRRYEDLMAIYPKVSENILNLCELCAAFPKYGTISKIKNNEHSGTIEDFFALIYSFIRANSYDKNAAYTEMAATLAVPEEIVNQAKKVISLLSKINNAANNTIKYMDYILDKDAATIEASIKARIEAAGKSIKARIGNASLIWSMMLEGLINSTPDGYIDFMEIAKHEGIEFDVALKRHFIDPTLPFAHTMQNIAKGIMITSATLNDKSSEWDFAYDRLGIAHFNAKVKLFEAPSPFNYEKVSKVIIVNDVDKNNPMQTAAAYRELFLASNGGALGIFTAISRLKHTYKNIKLALENQGISLLSQHIDDINTAALIDIFKNDEHSCLLGTDAIRDGIDVPGNPLRMIVFDRVPWSRSDILHKERKATKANKSAYDYSLTRAKLAQGFGRLIRKESDRGVFVILERATPTELLSAFPEGVEVIRTDLKNAVEIVKDLVI